MFAQRTQDEQMREILQPMHLPGFDYAPYRSCELYRSVPDSYGASKAYGSHQLILVHRLNMGGNIPY